MILAANRLKSNSEDMGKEEEEEEEEEEEVVGSMV
jgi:hypothetical protein